MSSFAIAMSPRLRQSPYFDATVRAGATAFTVYNHMLMPTSYAGAAEEYEALVSRVTVWDVAAERQVEIRGPDAERLTQYLCTRDVAKIRPGQARYTFVCNHAGGIINDPVLMRLSEDRFWLSLADRDVLLWAQAVAAEGRLDVEVFEPDVSPLQIQGPRSYELVRELFGLSVADLGYYRITAVDLEGVPMVVSRTGWSGEHGYEVFLEDGMRGVWLWDRVFAAGAPFGVSPAGPNQMRRLEGGILSYGTDMDDTVNPFELGLDRLVALDSPDDFIGRSALQEIANRPTERLLTGLVFDGAPRHLRRHVPVHSHGEVVGRMSSTAFSPRLATNIALAIVDREHTTPGTLLEAAFDDGPVPVTTHQLPFVESIR